jgi:hypothetical protein
MARRSHLGRAQAVKVEHAQRARCLERRDATRLAAVEVRVLKVECEPVARARDGWLGADCVIERALQAMVQQSAGWDRRRDNGMAFRLKGFRVRVGQRGYELGRRICLPLRHMLFGQRCSSSCALAKIRCPVASECGAVQGSASSA